MATMVTAKGQVTIPKAVRDYLGIGPGSPVGFKRAKDGSIVLVTDAKARPVNRFEKFRGHAGPGPSTDEIMEMLRGEP
ncbi:MAG: AbrB/MazE/SpoVT family DNA-binding domain-containing protein [Rhizobiaceae bacterium]|nr:AbrB/MazE/SpoVT family DNA-binding domain-containing protein [Rhizobiaceae bacterium]